MEFRKNESYNDRFCLITNSALLARPCSENEKKKENKIKRNLLITDLAHFKESAHGSHVALLDFLRTVHDRSTHSLGDAIVVRLAHAADCGDASLAQVVLREVRDTLFGNDEVGLVRDNVGANLGDILFLLPKEHIPIFLVSQLDVCLTFALLVLERAV